VSAAIAAQQAESPHAPQSPEVGQNDSPASPASPISPTSSQPQEKDVYAVCDERARAYEQGFGALKVTIARRTNFLKESLKRREVLSASLITAAEQVEVQNGRVAEAHTILFKKQKAVCRAQGRVEGLIRAKEFYLEEIKRLDAELGQRKAAHAEALVQEQEAKLNAEAQMIEAKQEMDKWSVLAKEKKENDRHCKKPDHGGLTEQELACLDAPVTALYHAFWEATYAACKEFDEATLSYASTRVCDDYEGMEAIGRVIRGLRDKVTKLLLVMPTRPAQLRKSRVILSALAAATTNIARSLTLYAASWSAEICAFYSNLGTQLSQMGSIEDYQRLRQVREFEHDQRVLPKGFKSPSLDSELYREVFRAPIRADELLKGETEQRLGPVGRWRLESQDQAEEGLGKVDKREVEAKGSEAGVNSNDIGGDRNNAEKEWLVVDNQEEKKEKEEKDGKEEEKCEKKHKKHGDEKEKEPDSVEDAPASAKDITKPSKGSASAAAPPKESAPTITSPAEDVPAATAPAEGAPAAAPPPEDAPAAAMSSVPATVTPGAPLINAGSDEELDYDE
jgi:hypothetical protein